MGNIVSYSNVIKPSPLKRKQDFDEEEPSSKKPRTENNDTEEDNSEVDDGDEDDDDDDDDDDIIDDELQMALARRRALDDPFDDEKFQRLRTKTFSFNLLQIRDTNAHTRKHINRIFLLDQTSVPEGAPTGAFLEEKDNENR